MKRWLMALMCVCCAVAMLTLSACGGQVEPEPEVPAGPGMEGGPPPEPPGGEPGKPKPAPAKKEEPKAAETKTE